MFICNRDCSRPSSTFPRTPLLFSRPEVQKGVEFAPRKLTTDPGTSCFLENGKVPHENRKFHDQNQQFRILFCLVWTYFHFRDSELGVPLQIYD